MPEKDANGFYEISLSNENTNASSHETARNTSENRVKVYKRRIWMLFLFSSLSLLCGMLYPQYVTLTNINSCYYGVSEEAVNWTSLMFMVVYIVLVFPVTWLMGRMELRKIILIGSLFNTVACSLQFLTLKPDSFNFVLVSTFFASLSNVFILAIPPCIAATWFPGHEVSRACAFGVFGNQVGIAIGFFFSPLFVVAECTETQAIAEGKNITAINLTALNALVFALIYFTFQSQPLHPPSIAQSEKNNEETISYFKTVLSMSKNFNFILIFIVYGLTVGVYFALSVLLNPLLLPHFPGSEVQIGWMGTLLVLTGLVGSIIAGYLLDYTHKFKQICLGICVLSLITFIIFICFVHISIIWIQFVTIGIFGFFLTSFLPVGFEYAIEVTYPAPEVASAGLLNASTMVMGLILTEIASRCLGTLGFYAACAVLLIALLMASLISAFITTEYRRSKKNMEVTSGPVQREN